MIGETGVLAGLEVSGPPALDPLDFRKTRKKAAGNARSSGYSPAESEWYVESAYCVDQLLDAEPLNGGGVFDPACGSGNVVRRCRARGILADGADLEDRAGGEFPQQDFLRAGGVDCRGMANIVCNPPFSLAVRFAKRALQEVPGKVVMLGRLAWLEGQERRTFFIETALSHVWVHSSRVSMPPGGMAVKATGGSTPYAWFVWRRTPPPAHPTLWWLR